MNVVGRVGSLISQGVYSVATPFHPFGGAVDVIVVQQQDGTFRSTPWYVRFGKFQGVLKGAEKIVRISVNGTEADFHMYLDNSGEAYFIKEVSSGKCSEVKEDWKEVATLEGAEKVITHDEKGNLGGHERTESDSGKMFYEFQDDQSSLEDSVQLSEYESSRYDNLEIDEHYVESEDSNSEVVLVSVDGHILTAPISSPERDTDDSVQLNTAQFHLGPGQVEAWTASYMNQFGTSSEVVSKENCAVNASLHKPEDCAGEEQPCQVGVSEDAVKQERESGTNTDTCPRAASTSIREENVFKSCLDIPALENHEKNIPYENIEHESLHPTDEGRDAEIVVTENAELACSNSYLPSYVASPNLPDKVKPAVECNNVAHVDSDKFSVHFNGHHEEAEEETKEVTSESAVTAHIDLENGSASVTDNLAIEEKVDDTLSIEQCSPQESADKSCKSEITEPNKAATNGRLKTVSRFQISLCGNLLHAGMGLTAATEVFEEHQISEWDFKMSAASIIKNENLVIRCQDKFLPWRKAAPIVLGAATYGLDLPVNSEDAIPVERDEELKHADDISELPTTPSGRRWRLWPIAFRKIKALEHTTSSTSSTDEVFVDSVSGSQNQPVETNSTSTSLDEHKQLLRINVPTTEQIASLNLKEGQNVITFSFCTRVLGMQQVDAHIYLWKWNTRIVISDVDGTITKSDVLGQFMPLVGRDWTQSGVARLFSAIKENGYQLLFLSARAIVQAYLTRSFLNNIKQDGKALPTGPVVISPDGLFPSLYREVIRRAPHEFKIACLEDIKALFPPDYNPFYAGFGNRDTDELSYRKIGIPKGKIFIINPKGEVAISQHRIDVKSYTSLHTLVNDMFPPTSMVEQEDFNSWNYWRVPLPDLD